MCRIYDFEFCPVPALDTRLSIWKHFRVTGLLWDFVDSSHKGQWRGALILSSICPRKKHLSKQSRRRWFDAASCSLWHQYKEVVCSNAVTSYHANGVISVGRNVILLSESTNLKKPYRRIECKQIVTGLQFIDNLSNVNNTFLHFWSTSYQFICILVRVISRSYLFFRI